VSRKPGSGSVPATGPGALVGASPATEYSQACGALSTRPDSCPDWGAAPLPVPDVIEEMVTRTLEDGGQISVIHGRPPQIVARLFPLAH